MSNLKNEVKEYKLKYDVKSGEVIRLTNELGNIKRELEQVKIDLRKSIDQYDKLKLE